LVLDDADLAHFKAAAGGDYWAIDKHQRAWAVRKIMDAVGGYRDDDLIIIGDVDEIPRAEHINILRQCATNPKTYVVT
jgi:hypothetical protein